MPYRNALRDNFQRFNQANDAEMRLAARQRMEQARPVGNYAGMSFSDMYRVLQGEQPQDYVPEPEMQMVAQQPQEEQVYEDYNPQSGVDALRRRRAELEAAAGRGY